MFDRILLARLRASKKCGHCSFCASGRQLFPEPPPRAPLPAGLDVEALRELRARHPSALAHPRQAARFLCGLASPATTRAKISRHPLFGALEDRPFAEVLAWCGDPGSERRPRSGGP